MFSWGDEILVTIKLDTLETESTVIEVTESGHKQNDPEIMNKMLGQKEGWVYTLTCLKAYLEHGITDLRASLIH